MAEFPKGGTEKERMDYFINESGLVGKKIVSVRYTTQKELDSLGWYQKAPILIMEDGRQVFIQQDDEGNGGGSAVIFNPADGKEAVLPAFG